jgi:tetratricopeptide (TPR) repeat protein
MEVKANFVMVGIVGILLVFLIILGLLYVGNYSEMVSLQNDVDVLNDNVTSLSVQLKTSEENRAISENFMEAFFSGWGTYYDAFDVEDTAWWNYNRADGYYDIGNWYNAVGYFAEGSTYFMSARSGYDDALSLFQEAENVSGNSLWVNLSRQCISMMDAKMKAMTFIRESSDRMVDTCNAYLAGSYDSAHDYYAEAQAKYGYYQEQMTLFDSYFNAYTVVMSEYV